MFKREAPRVAVARLVLARPMRKNGVGFNMNRFDMSLFGSLQFDGVSLT